MNLITNILENPEYKVYTRKVARLLGKQFKAFLAVIEISDKETREAALKMWHDKFKERTENLPEVIKTHIRCVETGKYRQLLKNKKANASSKNESKNRPVG